MKLLTSDQRRIMHTAKKSCQCAACAKAFSNVSDFDLHQRVYFRKTLYTCNKCGRGFCYSSAHCILWRLHMGGKCFRCGKGFFQSSQIWERLQLQISAQCSLQNPDRRETLLTVRSAVGPLFTPCILRAIRESTLRRNPSTLMYVGASIVHPHRMLTGKFTWERNCPNVRKAGRASSVAQIFTFIRGFPTGQKPCKCEESGKGSASSNTPRPIIKSTLESNRVYAKYVMRASVFKSSGPSRSPHWRETR